MYANVDRIEGVDAQTIKVTLKQPDAFWQYALATTAGHIISKAYYQKYGASFGKPNGGVLGTGAFKLTQWTPGRQIILTRYKQYWDRQENTASQIVPSRSLDTLIFKIQPDATARMTSLRQGDLGLLLPSAIPTSQVEAIAHMDRVDLTLTDSYLTDFIAFNTQRSPFNQLKVRQALNYAVDKEMTTRQLLGNAALKATATPISPRLWIVDRQQWQQASTRLPSYQHNLGKAKQLLTEAKVGDRLQGKTILTDDDPIHRGQALALQAAARDLGITLNLNSVSTQELVRRSFAGDRNYDLIVASWGSNFPDPACNLLPVFHSRYTG